MEYNSYKMFEPNMDDYLDDEMEELKRAFEVICKDWERSVSQTASSMVRIHSHLQLCLIHRSRPFSLCSCFVLQVTPDGRSRSQSQTQASQARTRFLDSKNPALMKRNVLASFTDALLLPVTIVPRAVGAGVGAVGAIGTGVGAAIGTGVGAVGTGVVQGIAMLNPQRWVGNGSVAGVGAGTGSVPSDGYESFGKDGALFEVGVDEDETEGEDADTEEGGGVGKGNEGGGVDAGAEDDAGWGEFAASRTSENSASSSGVGGFDAVALSGQTNSTSETASTKTTSTSTSTSTSTKPSNSARTSHASATPPARSKTSTRVPIEALDLLLSLDVSLQLIHATRDAIKRLETFAAYPGTTGTRVRETLDEGFCEMFGALGARHVAWGFGM